MKNLDHNYTFLISLPLKALKRLRKLNLKDQRLYLTKVINDLPRTQVGKGYVKVPSTRHVRFACPTKAYELLHRNTTLSPVFKVPVGIEYPFGIAGMVQTKL